MAMPATTNPIAARVSRLSDFLLKVRLPPFRCSKAQCTSCAARRASTARRASSATRSALIWAPAMAPSEAAAPTWPARSVTLPATQIPSTLVRPAASAGMCSPIPDGCSAGCRPKAVRTLGLFALEREARRERAGSLQRRAYIEALQGAVDEPEAKELLRRQIERLAPGADAVVLTRNASGNSLRAATQPGGGARARRGAGRRGHRARAWRSVTANTHERKPGEAQLQTCELCERVNGGTLCVPELVSGEVIGAVLVVKDRAIKPVERDNHRRGSHPSRPDARQPAQPRDGQTPGSNRPADQATQRPQRPGDADPPRRPVARATAPPSPPS